jgi:probable rRNA maturation factor
MIKANVILDSFKWKNKIKNPKNYFKKKLHKLSKISLFKKKNQEFSILLTNAKKMKSLNSKFRRKNKSTDVLSFPIKNVVKNDSYIGDIAICFEIINKRSKSSNFFLEFDKMWIHGYFHLIGYDHKKLKDFEKMSKKENLILQHFHKIN